MKIVFSGKGSRSSMNSCGCACHQPQTAPLASETAGFQVKHVWVVK